MGTVQDSTVPVPSHSTSARRVGSRSTVSWTSSQRNAFAGGCAVHAEAVFGQVPPLAVMRPCVPGFSLSRWAMLAIECIT